MKRPNTLGERGVSHFLVPLAVILLVAVAGTFTLVAKHARGTDSLTTAAAKVTKKKVKPSYIVVYGGGKYDSVKIVARNMDTKHAICAGSLAKNGYVTRGLRTTSKGQHPPLISYCTPTSGAAAYSVYYGKHHLYNADPVQIDIDAGYCTYVHPDPAAIRKVSAAHACSNAGKQSDTVAKVTPQVTVLSRLAGGKLLHGYVEVAVPGEDLIRTQCAGQVTLTVEAQNVSGSSQEYRFPVKYAKSKGKNGYCVSVIRVPVNALKPKTTYSVTADFSGDSYLNAASGVNDQSKYPVVTTDFKVSKK